MIAKAMSEPFEKAEVVIVGGAFSGAATALLLRRENPSLRVVVLEKSTQLERRVGEATTEVSGSFLTKRLGLTTHLNEHHIVKNGLRFWFTREAGDSFARAGELGAGFNVRLPTYQVDRAVLDEEVLRRAGQAGAEIIRGAKVLEWELAEGQVRVQTAHGERQWQGRWLVDSTGRAAAIARLRGTLQALPEHPTKALWARFRGVADLDSTEMHTRFPNLVGRVQTSRTSATNHLTGRGWWCWFIPLKGGFTSVGLVYDPRLFQPPEGPSIPERLLQHLRAHPLGSELMRHAEPVPGDARALAPLPYYSTQIAGPGWQIVGDAAGFMDPLYSAGLDYNSWTVSAAVERILREARGEVVDLETLNANFQKSFLSWFRGLYLDKYEYLGDRPLMTAAYLMDLGLFFFGPVREIVRDVRRGFAQMPFTGEVDGQVARLMAFYNARLAELARQKVARGIYGAENCGGCFVVRGFEPNLGVWRNVLDGAFLWLVEELRMAWRRWRQPLPTKSPGGQPISTSLPAPASVTSGG